MSSVFENNISVLRDKYPDISRYFERYIPDESYELSADVQIVADKKVLTARKDDVIYQLDSLYNSDILLNMWFDSVDKNNKLDRKYIMYGFGNGMYARKFLECASKDDFLIVCEPSDVIFYKVINEFDVSDIIVNDRFLLLLPQITTNKLIYDELTRVIKYTDVTTVRVDVYLNYGFLFEKEIKEFYDNIEKAIVAAQLAYEFLATRGRLINQNIKNNLKYLAKSKKITDLRDAFGGIPAIIVSAGPSLNKNVKELKRAKGKSLIIVVDSAIKTVIQNGIKPDLIIAVDPRKDGRFLGEDKCVGIPFVTCLYANEEIVREHDGLKFFDNTNDIFVQKFMEENGIVFPSIETGGSVATTAFTLARYMGCSPIILVGQDLGYTNDETHAKESVDAVRTVEELDGTLMDVDVFGNPIKTSADMVRYKEWFERCIQLNPNLTVYDATEGGALIKGSVVTNLRDVIDDECDMPCNVELVFEKASCLMDEEQLSCFKIAMHSYVDSLQEDKSILHKLLLNYSKMIEMVNLNKYNNSSFASLSRKSNELLKKVEEDPIMEYVMNNCYDRTNIIARNINHIKENEKEELISIIDISKKYAEILSESIAETEPDIIGMINNLDTI